ncbi:hypothetical protein P7C71_g2464, partial [Lecanoromycetidae sp. Uapishka_2]
MRLSQPPTLLSLLFTILSSTHTFAAPQNARDRELFQRQYHYLAERTSGQAACVASTNVQNDVQNGEWQYYTTTYVETDLATYTSTYSSFFGAETTTAAAAAATPALSCDTAIGEGACGTICCAVGQYCVVAGQCGASNSNGESSSSLFNVVTPTTTNTATAFIRPTSNVITTTTSTGSMTTTVPFVSATAASTAGSAAGMTSTTANNGLSGGAIAGIVIGVILAIIFLLLLCAFLCCKGLVDGILGFFGLRNRRRREETYIEERRSHHASGGGGGRTWFGTSRPSRVEREKKSSGIGGFTGVAAALTALAIILGLKRRSDARKAKTEYSESEYTYSDDTYTSRSSESSDRRTRNTRRSSRGR